MCMGIKERLGKDLVSRKKYRVNEEGLLETVDCQLLIPKKLQSFVLKEMHDTPLGGHKGREQTFAKIKEYFWWPRMSQ